MPCVGCEKECKCTAEKCADSCKCSSPGKCGCNQSKAGKAPGGGCCKKKNESGDGEGEKGCCKAHK